MPKINNRRQLRQRKKEDQNKRKTIEEDKPIQVNIRNGNADVLRLEDARNSSERSSTSTDVEIIDRQFVDKDEEQQALDQRDKNMNDNHEMYILKDDHHLNKLFDIIKYSEEAVSALPNRSWAIHCSELPVKRIIISEVVMHNVNGTGLEPFYMKQIVIDDRLNFDIFLLNSRAMLKDRPVSIRSMQDFEMLMDFVQSLKLCSGGPDYQQYSNITPECAFRDPTNKWRHNLCSLEVNGSDTCESCLSLDDILKKHAQRVKLPVKHKNGFGIRRKRPGESKDT